MISQGEKPQFTREELFNKYLLNIVLGWFPRKQILGRDLCEGGLLGSTLRNNPVRARGKQPVR